jgi:serine/threonine protein kinase
MGFGNGDHSSAYWENFILVVSVPERFLHSRYNIIRELARGSYTALYEAKHTDPRLADRPLALKVLCRPDLGSWFFRIAQVTASLDHPGIVPFTKSVWPRTNHTWLWLLSGAVT